MKRILSILIMALLSIGVSHAQKITDGSYRSVGFIKADGTVQDATYRTVGHIRKDGAIQDASYRTIGHLKADGTVQDATYWTIGHAKDLPKEWAALYFFFKH